MNVESYQRVTDKVREYEKLPVVSVNIVPDSNGESFWIDRVRLPFTLTIEE